MIAALFILAFAALLLLQIGATDALNTLRSTAREVDAAWGHDSLIFPDHINP